MTTLHGELLRAQDMMADGPGAWMKNQSKRRAGEVIRAYPLGLNSPGAFMEIRKNAQYAPYVHLDAKPEDPVAPPQT